MAQNSAGILLYRWDRDRLQVFLAHPGGPFWADKDAGAWTIPKGLIEEGEDILAGAVREFEEETGIKLHGPFRNLGTIRQKSGKIVHAWACEGVADPALVKSNTATLRWGGRTITVPEIDRCAWFDAGTAMEKINPAQAELILRLVEALSA
ncbi:MAG TPA: NUDIX domain-containing protein [Fimbriimonadaceae bacterium]|nr:NUDIX domain-containing protein [Fimbriimonadaceae bacterium]